MSQTITLEGASKSTGAGRKDYVPVTFNGRAAVGYYYTTGVVADTNIVTIGTRVYEFDTAAAPGAITAGRVRVDVNNPADVTADAAITALVTAINGDVLSPVDAIAWIDNSDVTAGCTLVARTEDNLNHALAQATANGVVSGATLQGGAVPAAHGIGGGTYGVTAADVVTLARAAGSGNEIVIGAITTVNQPTITSLLCQTAAGAVKALATVTFTLRQVNGNFWALTVEDGAAVLANGDVIAWTLGL